VALEVGIVGLPASGKTTLFTALTKTGGGEYGKMNVGMAHVADERLDALARVVSAKKVTPAAIRVQDVPGTGPALLGALRQVDALLVVLDAELAELSDDEAAAFRDGGTSALEEVVRRLRDALDLVTFFTAGEKETRAWPLRNGQTALDAAGTIHTDIARGFIRCEVIDWRDLVEAGSHAEASRRGRQRLDGKTYVVRDGDVLNIRFNV